MDPGGSQVNNLPELTEQEWGFIIPNWGPPIYGPALTEPSQGHLIPQSAQNFPVGYAQTPYLSPQSAQNIRMRSPQPLSLQQGGLGLEYRSPSQRSYNSLTGESELNPSPTTPGDQSPFGPQVVDQGGFTETARPLQSPSSPPVRNTPSFRDVLAVVVEIIARIGGVLYVGCATPDHSQLVLVRQQLQKALNHVNELIQHTIGHDRPANDDDKLYRCRLCPPGKMTMCGRKGTFKRHVTHKHHPDAAYLCPICLNEGSGEVWLTRKDKHHLHMRTRHDRPRLTKEELKHFTKSLFPPQRCVIPECGKPVSTWDEFIDCLCGHCSISDVDRDQDNGSDGDDSGPDDDNGDGGDGDGNHHLPSSGHGIYGNASNGHQYDQSGGYWPGNPGAGNGINSYRYHGGAADGMYAPSDQVDSHTSDPKSAAVGLDIASSKEPKPILTGLKHSEQPRFDSSATWADGDPRISKNIRTELSLRLKSSGWRHHFDKQDTKEEHFSNNVFASVNDEIIREFQRLRYFERRIYEHQQQGSFLTYVHETFVASHPERVIISSMREVIYQRIDLGSDKHPEIPGDQLFYLAREKDHRSSEANLEAARRASPKKRAHLRVRIRAIAGVLALRAAVSKTPLAVDNVEVGDGWELGIPLSPRATQEEIVKVMFWLVQVLVFFLRMPPNPKVYMMMASGSLEMPSLT
ncbi:hypothetical protein BDW62DRAFT_206545 [Aspergillus aurantiobrunneus]